MLDLEASALFITSRYYSGRQMGVEQLICSLGYAGCCDQRQSLHIRSVSYHQLTERGKLRSIGTQDFAIFEFRFFTSVDRRVGTEWFITCRTLWAPFYSKKK